MRLGTWIKRPNGAWLFTAGTFGIGRRAAADQPDLRGFDGVGGDRGANGGDDGLSGRRAGCGLRPGTPTSRIARNRCAGRPSITEQTFSPIVGS